MPVSKRYWSLNLTYASEATHRSRSDVTAVSLSRPAKVQGSPIFSVFVGLNGIRAGWRLLLFIVFFRVTNTAMAAMLKRIPAIHAWRLAQDPNVLTASGQIYRGGIGVASLLIAILLMTLIEKRSFADYYLAPRQTLGKRFWQGIPYGFAMVSVLMAVIAVFHGFSLGRMALSSSDAVKYGLLHGVGFILIALLEESLFRGYMQSTLGSAIRFWPSAIILSILFGALHLQNSGEAWFGALMAGSFGLLAAFALQRTGNVWFPVGMHTAWDWGLTYFYSAPDSGFLAKGHLLNSSFQGPPWITGGAVGPEGSAFVCGVLILSAIGIHFLFPANAKTRAI
jgi:membrane protease YdiL (CAAX protease family)